MLPKKFIIYNDKLQFSDQVIALQGGLGAQSRPTSRSEEQELQTIYFSFWPERYST